MLNSGKKFDSITGREKFEVLTHTIGTGVNENKYTFYLFCLWAFVLLNRPQDIFPALALIRPALATGILTVGVVVVNLRNIKTTPFFLERQVKYYTLLLLIMVLGIPFSLYPRLSFMVIFTMYINVFVFFFIFYKVVDSVKKLSAVLLVGCLGSGFYSAFSVASGSIYGGRLFYGRVFDPNDLAFFALGFLPLNLIFISRHNPFWLRLSCLLCFGSNMLLIMMTGSRGGFLAFGVSAALLLLFKTKTIKRPMKVAFIAMCIIFLAISPVSTDRYMTLLSLEDDYNVHDETGRFNIWKIGVRAMLANPLTGVGVGCFNNAVGLDREARGLQIIKWQTAHNSVVQIGTETGIIGLILYLLLSINIFRIFRRLKHTARSDDLIRMGEMGLVGFAGLFVAGMFLSQAYSIYWGFYLAFSAVVHQLLAKEQELTAAGMR